MSFPTVRSYVQHTQGSPEKTREHPVIDWMFDYEKALDYGDMKAGPHTPWHSDDFVYVKNGAASAPGAPSWAKLVGDYALFVSHYHEPAFYTIHETATGWDLIGWANIFANLPVPGDKVRDALGREWDIKVPGAFHFVYVKDPSGPKGLKLQRQELFVDGVAVGKEVVKRGIATWEQIAQL